jgi:hypothetical protein
MNGTDEFLPESTVWPPRLRDEWEQRKRHEFEIQQRKRAAERKASSAANGGKKKARANNGSNDDDDDDSDDQEPDWTPIRDLYHLEIFDSRTMHLVDVAELPGGALMARGVVALPGMPNDAARIGDELALVHTGVSLKATAFFLLNLEKN